MARLRSQYVCQQCGYESIGWLGKCPECNSWGSMVETVVEEKTSSRRKNGETIKSIEAINLKSIPSKSVQRTSTKISELDRVLGGGIVPGQVILMAGEPGIGKSTLLLQLVNNLPGGLYVSGEESGYQVKVRANRLGIENKNILFLESTDIDAIIATADKLKEVSVIIIDSIQTVSTTDLSGLAGSVGQVRESAFRVLRLAKSKNIPVFIVGHVTKEGTVAGPAVLAHIVDTVLWFEGDKSLTLRLLRAVKNRFGPTDEVGIFSMEDKGLTSFDNPEKIFLTQKRQSVPGSVVSSLMQGTRPILVEIQSLVVPSKLAFPKRVAQGFDSKRLELLLAVLIRRCGLPLYEHDVFVNVAGGITVREPGVDLAACLSIVSAYFDKPLTGDIFALGEVGLLGEIREVIAQEKRIKEAKRLGFSLSVTSSSFKYLKEAVKKLF